MSDPESNQIKFQIEGTKSDEGHVIVTQFVKKLEDLISVLNGVDRAVGSTKSPTLEYRVVNLSHNSPATVVLQPVVKSNIRKRDKDHVARRYNTFFNILTSVQEAEPSIDDADLHLLSQVQQLVNGLGESFTNASIQNGSRRINLDTRFERNVRRLSENIITSFGIIEGKLEKANIHGRTRRCWVWPETRTKAVICDFLPGTQDEIRDALGHFVRLSGTKYYRGTESFPSRIAVQEFEILELTEQKTYTDRFKGLEGILSRDTGRMPAGDFVRHRREDDWD